LSLWQRPFVRFLIVGVSNVVVGYLVFISSFHAPVDIPGKAAAAQLVAYAVGMLWSFYWNRRWTFQSTDAAAPQMARFLSLQVGCGLASVGLIGVAVDVMKLHATGSWLVVTVVIAVLNYGVSKNWAFKSR